MFLRDYWYVAAWNHEVSDKPLGRLILGEPIVMYRKADGSPVALEDRCPHRRVPLSLGQVINDELQCGYHGLRFSSEGVCTAVPTQTRIPPKAKVRVYPVVERYRWIWIWMGDPERADPNLITDYHWLTDSEWGAKGKLTYVKCNWQLIIDNLLDLSHLAFLHTSTIGNAAAATPAVFHTERGKDSVTVTRWILDAPPPTSFLKTGRLPIDKNVDRWMITHYTPPGFSRIDSGATVTGTGAVKGNRVGGVGFRNLAAITPETERTTHYFWAQAHNFDASNPDTTERVYQQVSQAVLEDVEMLEAQQKLIDLDTTAPMIHIGSDAGGNEARRIVERLLEAEKVKRNQRPNSYFTADS
jgi:vanillate O-demethylase monooxygenase subunit